VDRHNGPAIASVDITTAIVFFIAIINREQPGGLAACDAWYYQSIGLVAAAGEW
jgi:hypothetical protein